MVFIRKNGENVDLLNGDMKHIHTFENADMFERENTWYIHRKGCEFCILCRIPTSIAAILSV